MGAALSARTAGQGARGAALGMGGGAAFSPAAAQTGEGRGASRSGGPGGAGARGWDLRGGSPRREHGGAAAKSTTATAELIGEKVEKEEGRAEKLTGDSIWTEDGRRGKLDERGGAP